MNRGLALFAIGIIFGGGLGFTLAAGNGVTFDGHDHADVAQHGGMVGGGMSHDMPVEVEGDDIPDVQISLIKDPMAGYNLHVRVENFKFAPQQASLAHAEGQGHAHVFVNGVKQGRLYGPWVHLPSLPKGEVTVQVMLNANNHQPLAVNGQPIMASTTLTVE